MKYKCLALMGLLLLVIHGCKKVMLPEPQLPSEQKSSAEHEILSTNTFEETFQSITHEIINLLHSNNVDLSKTYAVFLQQPVSDEEERLKVIGSNLHKSMNVHVPIVTKEELRTILRRKKNITVLELHYGYQGHIMRVLVDVYSPGKKKVLFSLEASREMSNLETFHSEIEKGNSDGVRGSNDLSQVLFIDEIGERIIAIKSLDINKDNKEDLILLGTTALHIWLLAYNVVIDKISIPLGEMNEKRSRDPVGFIISGNNKYLYLMNSQMKNGVCISLMQEMYEIVTCTDEIISTFHMKQIVEVKAIPGTNLLRIESPEGTQLAFHAMDISMHAASGRENLYFIMEDNKIYGFDVNNLQLNYQSNFTAGRAFSKEGNYMITSLSNQNCPPDGVIIYALQDSKFIEEATLYESEGCIMSLDIQDVNKGLLQYLFSVYDSRTTMSTIYFNAVMVGATRMNKG